MRQNYTVQELQSILNQYSSSSPILKAKVFTTGFENSNYLIETATNHWVIKIYEDKNFTCANVSCEAQTMDFLFRRGILVPKVHQTAGGSFVANIGSKYAILMDYIKAEAFCERKVSDALMAEIGCQMGMMDAALIGFDDQGQTRQNYEFDLKHLQLLESKIDLLPGAYDQTIIRRAFEEFKAIQASFAHLKHTLIHNDVVLHNILVEDGRLCAIIDFNDFVRSPRVQNLAVTLCQAVYGYNWRPQQRQILIENYCRFSPLGELELSMLDTLIAARYAMLVVQFNYWNLTLAADPGRLSFLNDQYRFMQDFQNLRANSPELPVRGASLRSMPAGDDSIPVC